MHPLRYGADLRIPDALFAKAMLTAPPSPPPGDDDDGTTSSSSSSDERNKRKKKKKKRLKGDGALSLGVGLTEEDQLLGEPPWPVYGLEAKPCTRSQALYPNSTPHALYWARPRPHWSSASVRSHRHPA